MSIPKIVLVFKTNIHVGLEHGARTMLSQIEAISKIDFDFEDSDNILRIESESDIASDVEFVLNSNSYYCEELQ